MNRFDDSFRKGLASELTSDTPEALQERQCLECGYTGPEEECPECGAETGLDVEPVEQEDAAIGLRSESRTRLVRESGSHTMSDNGKFFGKPINAPQSEHLKGQPSDNKEHGSVDKKLKGRPVNTADETPIIKGTHSMEGKLKSQNMRIMKENVSSLTDRIRKAIRESAGHLSGKFKVNFSVLVTEGRGKNRTPVRQRLAEAVADVEEILQFHPSDDVVLEAWYINGQNKITEKAEIALGHIHIRGPLVSEGKAIFRFKRNAEMFAQQLNEDGILSRVARHNWGTAVRARVSMEQANNAFGAISEARTWGQWLGGLFGRKEAPQAEDPQAALRREMEQENERRGYTPAADGRPSSSTNVGFRRGQQTGSSVVPPGGASYPMYGGKMRKVLAPQLAEIDELMGTVKRMLKLSMESLIRKGMIKEAESIFGGSDDPEEWARQMAGPKTKKYTKEFNPYDTNSRRAVENILASIVMPDEDGFNAAGADNIQKIKSLVDSYLQKVKQANKMLVAFAQRNKTKPVGAAGAAGAAGAQNPVAAVENRKTRRSINEWEYGAGGYEQPKAQAPSNVLANQAKGLGFSQELANAVAVLKRNLEKVTAFYHGRNWHKHRQGIQQRAARGAAAKKPAALKTVASALQNAKGMQQRLGFQLQDLLDANQIQQAEQLVIKNAQYLSNNQQVLDILARGGINLG